MPDHDLLPRYDPTVEFLLGQLFHTLIYNEVWSAAFSAVL